MRWIAVAVAVASLAWSAPAAAEAPDPASRIPIQVTWDARIPMRDGVKLSAAIYRDPKQTRKVPAIVMMTPYVAGNSARVGTYFAQRGYVYVAIDARGRGNSDGVFVPGQVEARDGYDAIEWAAAQPWCDGQVATWGGSWLGFTQWSVAKEFPPHLKAMAPTASVHPGVDYPQPNGIFMSYALRWLSYVNGRALNDGLFGTTDVWVNAEWEQVSAGRPFADQDHITGITNTAFRTWLAHPREDAFWQALVPQPAHYAKLAIPILTITGHYDDDQLGALTYYRRHMQHGSAAAKARHWLVIGPWDHGGTRRPTTEIGGVSFGPSAKVDMEDLHRRWYDHVLKGGPVPELLKDRVAVFIMERNAWVHASRIEQLEGNTLRFELDATGAVAGDVLRSGHLATAMPRAASVALTSDPRYLPPRAQLDQDDPAYLKSQKAAYTDLRSQVAWHSAPLAAETTVSGSARLRLRVAVDAPDADLWADLYEVLADGSAVGIAATMVRLRHRKGGVEPTPMTPNKAELVELPPFNFTARTLGKGSRLRVIVNAGPVFGWQRNTHTGGDLANERLSAARTARITISTGPDTGSALELPRPDPAVLGPNTAKK